MRKEGKGLIIFQTWNKIIKIFYWLYWRYFLRNRNNERGGNWYNCQLPQLPIGGFVSGTHSDKATDCPLFVSRVRSARSLALFIVTTNSRPICQTNFKESARGSSFLWQNCKLQQLHLLNQNRRTDRSLNFASGTGWCKHTILELFEPSEFIIGLEKLMLPRICSKCSFISHFHGLGPWALTVRDTDTHVRGSTNMMSGREIGVNCKADRVIIYQKKSEI